MTTTTTGNQAVLCLSPEVLADPNLTASEKLVLALSRAEPLATQAKLATMLGLSLATVKRAVRRLKLSGVILSQGQNDTIRKPSTGVERRVKLIPRAQIDPIAGPSPSLPSPLLSPTPPYNPSPLSPPPKHIRGNSEQPAFPELPAQPHVPPTTAVRTPYNSAFEALWKLSPRGSKKAAHPVYLKALKRGVSADQIHAAREAHVAAAGEPRFVCHLERWLTKERWDEQPLPPAQPAKPAPVMRRFGGEGSVGLILR